MVSPKNSEITTISRKLAEKNSETMAKLIAPEVARSTSDTAPRPVLVPKANEITRMIGNSAIRPSANCVRRRRSCRLSSTRTGNVRPAEKPTGVPASVTGTACATLSITVMAASAEWS